jgi:hypothetical protein
MLGAGQENFNDSGLMLNPDSRRPIFVVLASLCFLMAIAAVAYHHHDTSFQIPTCSICKVKISLSGGFSKVDVDAVMSGSDGDGSSADLLPFCSSRIAVETSFVPAFQPLHPHSNKAPPSYS